MRTVESRLIGQGSVSITFNFVRLNGSRSRDSKRDTRLKRTRTLKPLSGYTIYLAFSVNRLLGPTRTWWVRSRKWLRRGSTKEVNSTGWTKPISKLTGAQKLKCYVSWQRSYDVACTARVYE